MATESCNLESHLLRRPEMFPICLPLTFQMNTPLESIYFTFNETMNVFNSSPAIQFLQSGKFTAEHYKSMLREIYHYAKEDPQLQALATVYFRGSDRHMVKLFLRHAISEVGHDLAALEDLKVLGGASDGVIDENPLPATIALTAYPFYEINYRNPIAYLGYLYFLEHMPTKYGTVYAEAIANAGVPKEAMGFLGEHMTVDVGHNKLMEKYLEHLVHDQKDADAVSYAIQVTGDLYAKMLWAAIERCDSPSRFGRSWVESARIRLGSQTDIDSDSAAHEH